MYTEHLSLNTPKFPSGIHAVLGPPGAGKTTLAKTAADELGLDFMSIDYFVKSVYNSNAFSNPMTDQQVEAALELEVQSCKSGNIVEFSHHNYVQAYKKFLGRASKRHAIAVIVASPASCYGRNRIRQRPVPEQYLRRCIRSTQIFEKEFLSNSQLRHCLIDTDTLTESQGVEQLCRFLSEN